jgi:hypothetical protein
MFFLPRKRPADDGDVIDPVIVDTRRQLILRITSTRDRIGSVREGNVTHAPFGIAQQGFYAAHSIGGPSEEGTNTLSG